MTIGIEPLENFIDRRAPRQIAFNFIPRGSGSLRVEEETRQGVGGESRDSQQHDLLGHERGPRWRTPDGASLVNVAGIQTRLAWGRGSALGQKRSLRCSQNREPVAVLNARRQLAA